MNYPIQFSPFTIQCLRRSATFQRPAVMGILNDPEGRVKVVIDKAVADAEWFACNPGANTSHLRFKTKQLINNFLPAEKHKPEIIML